MLLRGLRAGVALAMLLGAEPSPLASTTQGPSQKSGRGRGRGTKGGALPTALAKPESTAVEKQPAASADCHELRGAQKTGTTWTKAILKAITAVACDRHTKPGCRVYGTCGKGTCGKEFATCRHSNSFQAGVRYISTYRDPRDVAVSMWHWIPDVQLSHHTPSSYVVRGGVCRQVVKLFNEMVSLEAAAVHSNGAAVLRVFYEASLQDPIASIMAISQFIKNPLTRKQAAAVQNRTSFEAMRAQEASGALHLRVHPNSSKKLQGLTDPAKLMGVMTRGGLSGGYLHELNETAQAACLKEMHHLPHALRVRYLPVYAVTGAVAFRGKNTSGG